ncbi:toxin-antitoxin system TumE family protein [Spirosoma koreense]
MDDATFLKLKIVLTDSSVLYTKEYIDESIRNYAFQWQTAHNLWLMRWDNAPHFPKLTSFPHHRHDYRSGSEVVTDSVDITLTEVLTYIQTQLTT